MMFCPRKASVYLTLAVLLVTPSCARDLPRCSIEFALYGPTGEPLPFRITSVQVEQNGGAIQLLGLDEKLDGQEYRILERASRLYFSEQYLFEAPWQVTLTGNDGETAVKGMTARSCSQQRESLFIRDPRDDSKSSWFEKSGRITGCPLDADWWIRYGPLFGVADAAGELPTGTRDAYLDFATGDFTVQARHRVKHLLVVGRGAEPVKVFTAELEGSGTEPELGEFDLMDSCPTAGIR